MIDYLMPNEVLTIGDAGVCGQCGEDTNFVWLGTHHFCCLDCLDKYARAWGEEMMAVYAPLLEAPHAGH